MDLQAMGALQNLEQLKKIKQREVYCPLANTRVITTPLMTIDDISLRTSIMSVDLYDIEMTNLLFTHSTFPDSAEPITATQFIENMSYIDRQVLVWGIFASTYNSLGKNPVKCPYCENEWEEVILSEELIQEDSLTPWEHPVPFYEYRFPIVYDANIPGVYKLEFSTSLPTIKQHLDVLKLVPNEKIKENYKKFGTILSKIEELTTCVRAITLYKSPDDHEPNTWSSPMDIHMVISQFLTLDISDTILEKFNDHFNKYVPVFKKPLKCSKCENIFNFRIDPEVALFRQFLR